MSDAPKMTTVLGPDERPYVHKCVNEIVRSLGEANGGRLLDAPLGPGWFALEMIELGWKVSGADIRMDISEHLGDRVERKEANLNETIPFDDASFDMVTCVEGIEHVENHFHVLREFGRVVKPGGHLVMSTPNIGNLEERLNFLLRGAFFRYIAWEEIKERGIGCSHQNLITYLEMRQVFDWAGFDVIRVEKNAPKWKQNIFMFPIWCLIKAYELLQSRKRLEKYRMKETNTSNVLLGGATIILVGKRRMNHG